MRCAQRIFSFFSAYFPCLSPWLRSSAVARAGALRSGTLVSRPSFSPCIVLRWCVFFLGVPAAVCDESSLSVRSLLLSKRGCTCDIPLSFRKKRRCSYALHCTHTDLSLLGPVKRSRVWSPRREFLSRCYGWAVTSILYCAPERPRGADDEPFEGHPRESYVISGELPQVSPALSRFDTSLRREIHPRQTRTGTPHTAHGPEHM